MEFSALDLSSDAGLLLIKQAETNLQICQGITNCLEDKREQHRIRHPHLSIDQSKNLSNQNFILSHYFV